jgi:hypothetical protein
VCSERLGDEQPRAVHLSSAHGIRALTQERLDLDAKQVQEIYALRYGTTDSAAGPEPAAAPLPVLPPPAALPAPHTNGNGPAPGDVEALQAVLGEIVAASFAALQAENTALRQDNERLKEQNAWLRGEADLARRMRALMAAEAPAPV